AAPFVQSHVLVRQVFLQQRKPERCHSFVEAEWIGLIGPVQERLGPRVAMKMMLGLLVIKLRLCDCGIDLRFHSSETAFRSPDIFDILTVARPQRGRQSRLSVPKAAGRSSRGGDLPLLTSGFRPATCRRGISGA